MEAVITKIERIEKHNNADKLEVAYVCGCPIVVSIGTYSIGELVVYFMEDGQLSQEYCEQNDLFPRYENGNRIGGGFFDNNRKVRSQKFRGVRSDGYIAKLDSLAYTGVDISSLTEGLSFQSLNNHNIYQKWISPRARTLRERNLNKVLVVKEKALFREHSDTEQIRFYWNKIPKGSIITITEKLEGTSARYGYVPTIIDKRHFEWEEQLLAAKYNKKLKPYRTINYTYKIGTRRTIVPIINRGTYKGFYDNESFRIKRAAEVLPFIQKNEMMYAEIVGYTDSGAAIQPSLSTDRIKDKSLRKEIEELFGRTVKFNYNCPVGISNQYIYHSSLVNENGYIWHMPFDYTKRRTEELNISLVPILVPSFIYDGNQEELKKLVETVTEKNLRSTIDPSHLSEGVCIHVWHNGTMTIYKHKNSIYKILAGIMAEQDTINEEESFSSSIDDFSSMDS